jgi:hypothetical protein
VGLRKHPGENMDIQSLWFMHPKKEGYLGEKTATPRTYSSVFTREASLDGTK